MCRLWTSTATTAVIVFNRQQLVMKTQGFKVMAQADCDRSFHALTFIRNPNIETVKF